jgi:hypothetical protein
LCAKITASCGRKQVEIYDEIAGIIFFCKYIQGHQRRFRYPKTVRFGKSKWCPSQTNDFYQMYCSSHLQPSPLARAYYQKASSLSCATNKTAGSHIITAFTSGSRHQKTNQRDSASLWLVLIIKRLPASVVLQTKRLEAT